MNDLARKPNLIMILLQNFIQFHSLRAIFLIVHAFATAILIWTPYNSVSVTLRPNYSQHEYIVVRKTFIAVVSLGCVFLIFRLISLLSDIYSKSLRASVQLVGDIFGSFFILWMILDGLSWKTYVFVFMFCV